MTQKIIEARNLTVSFDGFKVLDNLTFSMNAGELRFLIGPNGAGKTTLLDVITGKTRAATGQISFDNLEIQRWTEHRRVQHGISRKFQTPSIFGSLTVVANLEVAVGFRSPLGQLLRPLPVEMTEKIAQVLEMIGLQNRARLTAGQLSHGEKQWLEIGMMLVQEPKLMLLDEPVAGMTRRERDHTGALLQAIGDRCSVLVVEHDMVFVRQFASTVTVLHMGQLLCEGPVETVQNDPRVVEVYLGRAHQKTA